MSCLRQVRCDCLLLHCKLQETWRLDPRPSVPLQVVLTLEGSGHSIVSVITTASVKNLNLQVGSKVKAVVKSTSVMISTEQ